ncbi:MAG: hypothetical protein ACRDHJ_03190 [Actinomycetota bacterium]
MCVLTGILWSTVRDAAEFGTFLLVLALLGGSALVAGGVWQRAAGAKTRVFVLVLVAGLAAGYVLASVLALLVTSATFVPGLSRVRLASWAGVVVGGLLYLLTLVEGLTALRERDRALGELTGP